MFQIRSGGRVILSSSQKLLQVVTEYRELLEFLQINHSDVLKKWKKSLEPERVGPEEPEMVSQV